MIVLTMMVIIIIITENIGFKKVLALPV